MYYINGQFVPKEDAKISVLDLGLLRGLGVFDYLRTYGGRPFHLWDHLLRFRYSAEHIGLTLPQSLIEIEEIIQTLLKNDPFTESSLKIVLTGGVSPDQFFPQDKSSLIILAYPLVPPSPTFYSEGIKVVTTELGRSLPMSKTTQYASAIIALQRGKIHSAMEALYLNAHREILEGTTSNFFGFKNGILHTCCSEEVLIGITREVVRKLAKDHFPVELRPIRYDEIPLLEEAFITSSNREIMPVVEIDGVAIGSGKVGAKTKMLMELFHAYTQQGEWPQLHIPRYEPISQVQKIDLFVEPLPPSSPAAVRSSSSHR